MIGSERGHHVEFWTMNRAGERCWWISHYNARGRGVGHIAKGYWYLSRPSGELTPWFEVGFAIGGEDNMVQAAVKVWSLKVAAGVRFPRWATRSWVYERRSWSLALGAWSKVRVEFAYDDGLDGMDDYYREARGRGETLIWPRAATTNGWRWDVPGVRRWLTGTSREAQRAMNAVARRTIDGGHS